VELESELAAWLGFQAALVTASAFGANQGLLPALAAERDALIVSDAANHASIIDGCRLARAKAVVVPHLDVEAVEQALSQRSSLAPAWVVTEGLFSMDGDSPDLQALRSVCDRFEAGLIVDEAHSLGVLGPTGGGLAEVTGVRPDLVVAGLGKAIGGQGGVIASSDVLRTLLWNRSRSFVFSTAVSPLLCRLLLVAVRSARSARAQRSRVAQLARELRAAMTGRGLAVRGAPSSPIVPVVVGSNDRAMRAMHALRARGVLAQAIRPPTVPPGEARLRLTVHADWPSDAIPLIIEGLEEACAS
jgi:8-amino-7-oxononanoate synthase